MFSKKLHSSHGSIPLIGLGLIAICGSLFLCAPQSSAAEALSIPYEWETSTTIPSPPGMEITASALSNGALIVFGNTVPSSGEAISIRYNDFTGTAGWNDASDPLLAPDFSCGASTVSDNALFCAGGDSRDSLSPRVSRLEYDRETRRVVITSLPDLPEARGQSGAVIYKDQLFVAGGYSGVESDTAEKNLWMLDLSKDVEVRQWSTLPPIPDRGTASPRLAIQDYGDGDALYLLDGVNHRNLEYNLLQRQWRLRRAPALPLGSSAFAVGTAHVFTLPALESNAETAQGNQSMAFLAYHTITDTWVRTETLVLPGRPHAVHWDADQIVITSVDGAGAVQVTRGSLPEVSSHFRPIDYGVLFIYFAVLIYMGHWFSKRENTTDDFFRGGKRVPGWAAGISIIGTKFSAVSFMSIPAKTFATNWNYFGMQVGILVAAVVVIRYFIPFFCNLDVTTAYEYLERRFNLLIRLIGSVKFILFEIFRMGILVLLPSIVLSVITGIDITLCILTIGVVSTIYTILGGIEAVIWTDVIQVFIMVGGTIFGIIYALVNVDAGTFASMGHAVDAGKTQVFDLDFTLTTATIWVLLLSLPAAANNYVSNQTIVQRFISTKDVKQAARSMWVTAILGPAILFLFYVMGTALFLFYQSNPARLNVAMQQPDEVLAWYIVRELPAGISGLLVGAVFAATMSSLDSALSSTSTVFVSDIYRRFKPTVPDHKALRLAKILTAALGILGTGSALLLVAMEIKSLFDEFMTIMGLLGGGLAGIFILGTMTKRTHSVGVLIGFLASIFVLYYTKIHTDLHFFLYGAVGMGACVVVGYISSLLIPVRQKSLDGMTIHTPGK